MVTSIDAMKEKLIKKKIDRATIKGDKNDVESLTEDLKKAEATYKADMKVVTAEESPGKTGLIIGLIVGLIGIIGIGLYIYKKKTQDDEGPEGGEDDKYS